VSNIARHAQASSVSVDVQVEADRLQLRISDDGIGLDAEADWGAGLSNSARRAALLNGVFHIRRGKVGTVALLEVGLGDKCPSE